MNRKVDVSRAIWLGAALWIAPALMTTPAWAQGAPQTMGLVKVDPQTVATGYRASKIIGSSVVNDANETVGKVDDVIIGAEGQVPFAVLAVGGFLGLGNRLVVVPYANLKFVDDRIVLPSGSKDELRALPEFKYAENR